MEKKKIDSFMLEIEVIEKKIQVKWDEIKRRKYEFIEPKNLDSFSKMIDSIYNDIYNERIFFGELMKKNEKGEINLKVDELAGIYHKFNKSKIVLDALMQSKYNMVYNINFPKYYE